MVVQAVPSLSRPSLSTPPLSRRQLLLAGGALGTAGLLAPGTAQAATPLRGAPATDRLAPTFALEWIRTCYYLSWREGPSPTQAARCYNYLSLAMYEACVGGMPAHRSVGGQLTGLGRFPTPKGQVDWLTALAVSAHDTAMAVYAGATDERRATLTALRDRQIAQRRAVVPPSTLKASAAHGRAVAAVLTRWTTGDGWAGIQGRPYTPVGGEDRWEQTPPNYSAVVEPFWSEVRPMVMTAAAEVTPVPHLRYSTDPASAFFAQAQHVVDVSRSLTDAQRTTASFWSDNPLFSGLPSGHWMLIMAQVAEQHSLSLASTLEGLARLGVALHEAFLSCWTAKYAINLLRPITYIHRHIDPGWRSFVNTPQFPEYTSGHSVASAAAATVLTDLFGDLAFTDDSHRDRAMPSRDFPSFRAAAEQAAISRIYGGIHFPMGIENGLPHGTRVGQLVLARLRTRR